MALRGLIAIDVTDVLRMADALGHLSSAQLGQVGLTAVNDVAPRMERKAREGITETINVTDSYVAARMGVRLADDPARPEAIIYAPFRHTPLGRYEPRQLVQPVKHPERSKGDKLRKIAPGKKSAGVSVEVVRGERRDIRTGFLMPLRNGNGIGVFTRERGALRFQHRLGPSVYQLFRVQADRLLEETTIELQLAVIAEAERLTEEVFA